MPPSVPSVGSHHVLCVPRTSHRHPDLLGHHATASLRERQYDCKLHVIDLQQFSSTTIFIGSQLMNTLSVLVISYEVAFVLAIGLEFPLTSLLQHFGTKNLSKYLNSARK